MFRFSFNTAEVGNLAFMMLVLRAPGPGSHCRAQTWLHWWALSSLVLLPCCLGLWTYEHTTFPSFVLDTNSLQVLVKTSRWAVFFSIVTSTGKEQEKSFRDLICLAVKNNYPCPLSSPQDEVLHIHHPKDLLPGSLFIIPLFSSFPPSFSISPPFHPLSLFPSLLSPGFWLLLI